MHKSLLEYIDVVAEETSPTSIILAVAELMRKEADASRETAKTSIFVFLDKLKNAGLAIDYTGLKSYFDSDPKLSNVIQQFNDREIEFVGQGDENQAPDTGAPVGEVPPEKKVNQMAKAALAKRESIGEDKVFRTSGPGLTGAKQIKELPKGVDKVRGKKGVYMDQDYYYHVISEASTLDESTEEYGKSMDKIARDKQMAGISSKDKDALGKLSSMMDREREMTGYNKMMQNYAGSDAKKVNDILSRNGWRLGEQGDTLVRNMLKKHDGNIKKAADDIMQRYPNLKKEEVAEEYYYDMVGFIKMSDDKLKAWIKRNDTDEPGISPVFGQQIKSAKRELIKRGLKLSESINNVLRLSGIKK